MTEGAWNEVEQRKVFVKFAFDDVLKKCNWASEKERGHLQAKIEALMSSLDEKGPRLKTRLSELRSIDLQNPTTVDAERVSELLKELERDKSFLEGPLGKKFGITSFQAACKDLGDILSGAEDSFEELWGNKDFQTIQSIELSLHELAKVDRLPKVQEVKASFRSLTRVRLGKLKEAVGLEFQSHFSMPTREAKAEQLRLVNRLLEDDTAALKAFEPPDRFSAQEQELLRPIIVAMGGAMREFERRLMGREWTVQDVAIFSLQLWSIASEISHGKVKTEVRTTVKQVLKARHCGFC
jgi:hypothetical protein